MATILIPSEDKEQQVFIQWFRFQYKNVRIFSIPNGGARHIAVASKLKSTGVMPGVPDLFIPEWRLWIEMKRRKGGVLSPTQKDWIDYLTSVGYDCIVAYGADDAINQIKVLNFVDNN